MTVLADVVRVQQQLRHLPWHEHSSNVVEKMPVRSTHLSLRRRRRVFDVAAQRHRRLRPLFQASVNRSTKLTLSSSVGVCQRPGRTPSSRSSELFVLPGPVREVTFSTTNVFRSSYVDASDSNATGSFVWLPCISASPSHWSYASTLLLFAYVAY